MAEEPMVDAQQQAEGGETTERDMLVKEGAAVQEEEPEPHKGESGEGGAKRAREEGEEEEEEEEEEGKDECTKKPRVDESTEGKDREGGRGDEGEKEPAATTARVGPKVFTSSVEMFDYFVKLLQYWSPNVDLNKYEHMVLLDLLEKGHSEPAKKIGEGIQAFQVRYHPLWKSRCFFLVRVDGTSDDFSFRKCIDNILPLPENMKAQGNFFEKKNQKGGGGGRGGRGGGGGRGGRGRGRGRRGGFGR